MTTNNLLGSQLRIMLSGLSEHGIQHFTEIETDLIQTNLLLEEAIAKLVASFMAVNGSICVQQEMLDSIISGQSVTSDNVAGMKAISDEIGRHINDAITGLQFQDMTRQLIERSLKRVIGMRGILNALGSSGAGMSPDGGVEQIVPLLKSINRQLVMQNEELKDVLWKTVRQKHMDSGDVELF